MFLQNCVIIYIYGWYLYLLKLFNKLAKGTNSTINRGIPQEQDYPALGFSPHHSEYPIFKLDILNNNKINKYKYIKF